MKFCMQARRLNLNPCFAQHLPYVGVLVEGTGTRLRVA